MISQLLYKVVTVFPTPEVFNSKTPNTAYTFASGTYEYPFQFKVYLPRESGWFLGANAHEVSLQQCLQRT